MAIFWSYALAVIIGMVIGAFVIRCLMYGVSGGPLTAKNWSMSMAFQINNRDFHKLMALLMEVRTDQRLIISNQENMMKTLDDIFAGVEANKAKAAKAMEANIE